ncbi:MAG: hypothetical protein KC496_16275 [Anaerolineae bacterium]|nr:hypothetical protein [Anaerolineae bacterium]
MTNRQQLLQKVDEARNELWHALDQLDDATTIYPGWQKREFFAHIAGWEAMVFDSIRAQISGVAPLDHAYRGIESANERFVAVRKSLIVQDARLECEVNRFAILQLLATIKNDDEPIMLPWGSETVVEFLEGAIRHERDHAEDIQHLIGKPL